VTMPDGMTINPAAVDGLDACSEDQVGIASSTPLVFNDQDPACPDASKVGSVQIDTPALNEPLTGSLYLAKQKDNPFHSLLAGYLVAHGGGALIKAAGQFDLDAQTGRVTAIFDNNPQQPFSKLQLHFFSGAHSPLTTPSSCGVQTISAELTSWT